MAKIFSRFDSVAPTQRSRKFLKHDARDAELARPALHEERLAGADAAGDQVAHGQRAQRAAAQQLGVLAQPGLDRVVAGDVVERERRLDELEQSLALALDQILLDLRRATPTVIRSIVAERQRDRRPRADAAQAGEPRADRRRSARRERGCEIRKLCGRERLHVGRHLRLVRQRQVQRRRVRVVDHELVQVVQPLADQHGDDVRLHDGRIVGPAEHLDGVGRERAAELQRRRRAARRTRRTR